MHRTDAFSIVRADGIFGELRSNQGSQRLQIFRKYAIYARKRHVYEEKYMFLNGQISGNFGKRLNIRTP